MNTHLFTYGTLQVEEPLGFLETHNLTQHLSKVGQYTINGDLVHLYNHEHRLHYPGVLNHNQSPNKVTGSVFLVSEPEHVFVVMDEWEGFDPSLPAAESRQQNFYERTAIFIPELPGAAIDIYLLNDASDYYNSPIIENRGSIASGDWLTYQKTISVEQTTAESGAD